MVLGCGGGNNRLNEIEKINMGGDGWRRDWKRTEDLSDTRIKTGLINGS